MPGVDTSSDRVVGVVPGRSGGRDRHALGLEVTGRLRALRASPVVPVLLLLLALGTAFVFGGDRGHFYRGELHSALTQDHLSVAANMSLDNNFLGFYYQTLNRDGTTSYHLYNRFPIGGYLLIKLAILPFSGDLSAQILAARVLMLLAFAATAVLAWLSLCRLTSNRWIALTAVLLTFSSYFWLFYNDMVSTEIGLDLMGLMLTFHGMVIFVQEGRFRQLLYKTCAALLLGWHVYALLLPFVVLGAARDLIRTRRAAPESPPPLCQVKRLASALVRSRCLQLGAAALLVGTALLSFNVIKEYAAAGGDRGLTDLPSVTSMLQRTGLTEHTHYSWTIQAFLESQFNRLGKMSLPYAFTGPVEWLSRRWGDSAWYVMLGLGVFGTCLLGLGFVRHKILWAALTVSGFCWVLPVRYTAYHPYESLAHTGAPLVFFSLVLLCVHQRFGVRPIIGLSAIALLVFALSSFQMARIGRGASQITFQEEVITDFEAVRRITDGYSVFVTQPQHQATSYYLAGSTILYSPDRGLRGLADFEITRARVPGLAPLTPDNLHVFLYDRAAVDAWIDRMIETEQPAIRSNFDVYLFQNRLVYVNDACRPDDAAHRFFLHVVPADPNDLPDYLRDSGFVNLDLHFGDNGLMADGRCLAIVHLPDYAIASIRTGQYVPGTGEVWSGELYDRDAVDAWIDRMIETEQPAIRSNFDVYLFQNRLVYVNDACRPDDAAHRFFLHVVPADPNDLPDYRRDSGFVNLDFDFGYNRSMADGRCLAIVHLPDYAIAGIRTGQFAPGTGAVWHGEITIRGT